MNTALISWNRLSFLPNHYPPILRFKIPCLISGCKSSAFETVSSKRN